MPPTPLPTTALGRAAAAAVVWRQRGALSVTAVLKATFSLVPEGRMALTDPDPIAAAEQPDPSGRGLRTAGDLAPYLGQVDVWLTGHAEVPPHYAEPSLHVRLSVVQGGAVRIDKGLDLDASVRAGQARAHIPVRGLDPISRQWPVRRNLLGDLDPRRLEGSIVDLPEGFDWRYFHTVPADQRLEAVTGDEWIILGGMVLRRPRLRTQLPGAQGAARLYRKTQAAPRAGEPIPMRADMLQIDVDRLRCAIVWRGHVRVRDEAELGGLHLVAGVEMPGHALPWADPFPPAPPAPAAPRPPPAPPPAPAAPPTPVAPPSPAAPTAAGDDPLEMTMAIPSQVAAVFRGKDLPDWMQRPAGEARRTPSSPKDAPAAARPAPPPRPPAAPRAPAAPAARPGEADDNPIGTTLSLSQKAAAQAAAAPATPFIGKPAGRAPAAAPSPAAAPQPSAPAPPAAAAPPRPAAAPAAPPSAPSAPAAEQPLNPIGTTLSLSSEAVAKVASSRATPFSPAPPAAPRPAAQPSPPAARRPAAPAATPAPGARAAAPPAAGAPAPTGNPLEGTLSISNDTIAKLASAAVTPFEGKPMTPPPPPPSSVASGAQPAPARSPVADLSFDDDPAPDAPVAAWTRGPGDPPPPLRAPLAPPAPPALLGSSPAPAQAALAADLPEWPPGLGAEFLAAMAEAGALVPPPDRPSAQGAAF